MTPLSRIRIVLSQTSHPGNIGAAARAMMTMGLSQLWLVAPKHFPDEAAVALAAGATRVLDEARVVDTLNEALSGVHWTVGMTTRRREISLPTLWVEAAAMRLCQLMHQGEVAVVFGNEAHGLNNQDLSYCQAIATIPTGAAAYDSLNLAAAVQVMSYELRKQCGVSVSSADQIESPLATFEEREHLMHHFETLLKGGKLHQHHRAMRRLRRLFAKANLEQDEVNLLHGILKNASQKEN